MWSRQSTSLIDLKSDRNPSQEIALGQEEVEESHSHIDPSEDVILRGNIRNLGQCLINDHFVISTHQTYVDLGLANRRALAQHPPPPPQQ